MKKALCLVFALLVMAGAVIAICPENQCYAPCGEASMNGQSSVLDCVEGCECNMGMPFDEVTGGHHIVAEGTCVVDNEIPEFGIVGMGIAGIGGIAGIAAIRKIRRH